MIDTFTGMTVAIKYKKFSSKGLSKFIKKIITYTVSIMTVRLLEMGVMSLVKTTILSQIMIAFLALTETVSTLENLALLGVPIPGNFISFLFGNLKIPQLNTMLKTEHHNVRNISDIEELIKYQIPTFGDKYMRRLLEISFEAWKDIVLQINNICSEKMQDSNEIIYYKLMALIELEFKEMKELWKEEKIPQAYIDRFYLCHQPKMERWLNKIRYICFSEETIERKKEQLTDGVRTILYQTILDGRRCMDNIVLHQ